MSYYSPKLLALFTLFIVTVSAFAFPIYGLIFAKILFILMDPISSDFWPEINFWCGMFVVLAGGIFITVLL